MQLAACPRNGTGLQASARPARGDPVSLFTYTQLEFLIHQHQMLLENQLRWAFLD